MNERTITITIRRSMPTVDWCEHGRHDGPALPAGTVVTIKTTPIISPGSTYNDGGEVDHQEAMLAGAVVPCEHLDHDWDSDDYNRWDWFQCKAFPHMDSGVINVCMGDKCRCCSSKVRAEAAASLQEQTTTSTQAPDSALGVSTKGE